MNEQRARGYDRHKISNACLLSQADACRYTCAACIKPGPLCHFLREKRMESTKRYRFNLGSSCAVEVSDPCWHEHIVLIVETETPTRARTPCEHAPLNCDGTAVRFSCSDHFQMQLRASHDVSRETMFLCVPEAQPAILATAPGPEFSVLPQHSQGVLCSSREVYDCFSLGDLNLHRCVNVTNGCIEIPNAALSPEVRSEGIQPSIRSITQSMVGTASHS
mmetsp:Transcript_145055/g.361811  ORF Transcript_145055/g.361811 Transcript_145055/m.361811 type:complete len:220 (-) Transcript_145055:515-1174(-)